MGGWPIVLIALHVVFITLGYAQASHVGVVSEFWTFIVHYPDVLAATVAFALLVMAGVSSIPAVRRSMKYQTWWAVHLYLYLALVLGFAHQIKTGVMFIGHPLATDLWIGISAVALAAVVGIRIVRPLVRNLRHQLRISSVREEAPGVYSLVVKGATSRGSRSPEASSSSGGSWPGASGGTRTRTLCRRCPILLSCA